MHNIAYRKATLEDCYSIAELKGIVWNTTYKGIYPDEKLTGYDEFMVAVNSRNINAIQFYLAMGGKIVFSEEKQFRMSIKV